MKGMRGRLLKKLKSVRQIGFAHPKHDPDVVDVAAESRDGSFAPNLRIQVLPPHPLSKHPQQQLLQIPISQTAEKAQGLVVGEPPPPHRNVIHLELEEGDQEFEFCRDNYSNKENIFPSPPPPQQQQQQRFRKIQSALPPVFSDARPPRQPPALSVSSPPSLELGEPDSVLPFRRPDLNSGSLFDPNLLAAFQQAVADQISICESERKARRTEEEEKAAAAAIQFEGKRDETQEPPFKPRRMDVGVASSIEQEDEEEEEKEEEDDDDPLSEFEEKCPPGGSGAVILYTTSIQGIRKTFEECNRVRFLLESFRVVFCERDVSMHLKFREELRTTLGGRGGGVVELTVPPQLFVKGRHIGGADVVLGLHEQGKLRPLLQTIPIDSQCGVPCQGCSRVRFILCFRCSGGRKIVSSTVTGSTPRSQQLDKCPECNENGLIICPLCC